MPTYEYVCDSCDHRFEVEQSMRDNPLTTCPQCSGSIRRVFGLSSVIFKGSGFYATDARNQCASAREEGKAASCAACPASQTSSS
jgi:putative FmdB family regulatory protein